VFPVTHEVNFYILFRRNAVFEEFNKSSSTGIESQFVNKLFPIWNRNISSV
jgi:hypothetical protein